MRNVLISLSSSPSAGLPEIPARDAAVGAPAFAEGAQGARGRQVRQVVPEPRAVAQAQIVSRQDIQAAKRKYQIDLCRPTPDPFDRSEPGNDILIIQFWEAVEIESPARDLFSQIAQVGGFLRRETRAAQRGVIDAQHSERFDCAQRGFQPITDGSRCRQRDLLADDRIRQGREAVRLTLQCEWANLIDQGRQRGIYRAQMADSVFHCVVFTIQ